MNKSLVPDRPAATIRLITTLAMLASVLIAVGPAAPADAQDDPPFQNLLAPFACGTEWSGGTRDGHGFNDWDLDLNRTSLVWPDPDHDLNQPLLAQANGVITWVGLDPDGAGTYVDIDYSDYTVRYVHLVHDSVPESIDEVGATVETGDLIGLLGDTGNATHAHLHLEYFDSRGIEDARIWHLPATNQVQIVMDGEPIEEDEVFVSTNCDGDPIPEEPPTLEERLLADARDLADPDSGALYLIEQLQDHAVSLADTTDTDDYFDTAGVVAKVPGGDLAAEVVLVTVAHRSSLGCEATDAVPCTGATRNAAPTTAALELIRRLAETGPRRTVVVAFLHDQDEVGTTLTDWLAATGDPVVEALVNQVVAAVELGPLGENATIHLRNDSTALATGNWIGWDEVTPAVDRITGVEWHEFGNEPFARPNIAALAALDIPTVGFADVEGACSTGDSSSTDVIDIHKLVTQLDDLEGFLEAVADADAAPTFADPLLSTSVLADALVLHDLLVESEATAATPIANLAALLADPPDPVEDSDAATVTSAAADATEGLAFEPCAAHRLPAPFVDMWSGSYALADVALLFDIDVTTGTTDTTYSPTDFVTREQMGAFLARVWRLWHPDASPTEPMLFDDVDPESYAFDDIRLIFELGITLGETATTYVPDGFVTRVQMGAFLARLWRLVDPDHDPADVPEHDFTDVDPDSYAWDDISLIAWLGITKGTTDTTYSPDDLVTREQMGAFLARLIRAADALPPT